MKKVLMLSLAILMVASYAMADDIGVYTDQAGTDCDFVATGIGPLTVYVVHHTAGATGSQFKVVNTSSWSFSASVLGGFLSIGDAFSDLSLAYGGCNAGPAIAVVALNGFTFPFPGAPCGQITVQAAPNKVGVIGVDCIFAELPASAGKIVFDPNATCPCVEPNATEQSTWGNIKSLYR
jgi:hypothetical protein